MLMSSRFMVKSRIVRIAAVISSHIRQRTLCVCLKRTTKGIPEARRLSRGGRGLQGLARQQVSNRWVQLVVVPQNGGRLIQVTFAGHPYLFVNQKFAGTSFLPLRANGSITAATNSGFCPKAMNDEQHWAGDSDIIDDGPFTLRKVSEGKTCEIELTGPADPQTGIPVCPQHFPGRGFFPHSLSCVDEKHQRPFAGLVDASRIAIRHVGGGAQGLESASAEFSSRFNQDFWTFTPAKPLKQLPQPVIMCASVRLRIRRSA